MTEVAFIGLGNMGLPMAKRLLDGGYRVTGYDASEARADLLRASGGRNADSPMDAASGADLVLSMLPADRHVEEVVAGPKGIIHSVQNGATWIDFSTVSPRTIQDLAKQMQGKGVQVWDAAVGPGPDAAAAGELTIMLGGDSDLPDTHEKILALLSSRIIQCGKLGSAKAIKIANNLVTGVCWIMNAEAMLLATKAGADPKVLANVMKGTAANTAIGTVMYPEKVLAERRNYEPGFRLALMHKDIALALALAQEVGLHLKLGEETEKLLNETLKRGWADDDVSRVVELLEEAADVRLNGDHASRRSQETL